MLDADNGRRLESPTGRVATRDIVQFIPMREVQSKYQSVFVRLFESCLDKVIRVLKNFSIRKTFKKHL